MNMRLRDLLKYDNIVVQCHDNPDADSIASGFGVYLYLKNHNKKVSLIYAGKFRIQKSNLVLMVSELNIPIEHVRTLPEDIKMLVMADCQYGEGNVTSLSAPLVVDIDHHRAHGEVPQGSDVRSNIGSCSTIVWDLLRNENEKELLDDRRLGTALYYGLYTDTSFFTEISHPLDKDMRDTLSFDKNLIMRLKNSNMSLDELKIAGASLLGYEYYPENRYAILRAEPCDPNILGLISDFALEVDRIDICIVYTILDFGIKFSVRSCNREVNANELAVFLADGIGSAGGHTDKAGGMLDFSQIADSDVQYRRSSADKRRYMAADILRSRMDSYFRSYNVIFADRPLRGIGSMKMYQKLPVSVGFVKALDIFGKDSRLTIRMLEGDFDIAVHDDTYIMIGVIGEIYPISKEKFDASYRKTKQCYSLETEYEPTVRDAVTGEVKELLPLVRSCVSRNDVKIYAKRLRKTTKVFTTWNKETYMLGNPGDMLAVRSDDIQDMYIIKKNVFEKCYEKV